jgi:hypothetical protein
MNKSSRPTLFTIIYFSLNFLFFAKQKFEKIKPNIINIIIKKWLQNPWIGDFDSMFFTWLLSAEPSHAV